MKGRYCEWCGQLDDWCEQQIESTHGACCKKCTHDLTPPKSPFGQSLKGAGEK